MGQLALHEPGVAQLFFFSLKLKSLKPKQQIEEQQIIKASEPRDPSDKSTKLRNQSSKSKSNKSSKLRSREIRATNQQSFGTERQIEEQEINKNSDPRDPSDKSRKLRNQSGNSKSNKSQSDKSKNDNSKSPEINERQVVRVQQGTLVPAVFARAQMMRIVPTACLALNKGVLSIEFSLSV